MKTESIEIEHIGKSIIFELSLCKAHRVKYLYAFGSAITTRFDKDHSDIDLLVDIDTPDPVERG